MGAPQFVAHQNAELLQKAIIRSQQNSILTNLNKRLQVSYSPLQSWDVLMVDCSTTDIEISEDIADYCYPLVIPISVTFFGRRPIYIYLCGLNFARKKVRQFFYEV